MSNVQDETSPVKITTIILTFNTFILRWITETGYFSAKNANTTSTIDSEVLLAFHVELMKN